MEFSFSKLVKDADLLPEVKLQDHQRRLAEEAEKGPLRKLLFHGLGSGKSLSSIAASEARKEPYSVIVPASLRQNYLSEQKKFTDKSIPSTILSYTNLASGKRPPEERSSNVLFDEAHRLRNTGTSQTQNALDLSEKAKQVLLLTGTPVTNRPSDFAPLMSMLVNKQITPYEFDKRYIEEKEIKPNIIRRLMGVKPGIETTLKNTNELKSLLKGHIDYYHPSQPVVPVTNEEHITELGKEQSQLYRAMWDQLPWHLRWKLKQDFPLSRDELKKMTSFLTGPRQVGLSTYPYMKNPQPLKAFEQSPKLQKAFSDMQEELKDPRTKALVFANFIDAGLTPYSAALEKNNIPHAIFHGGLSDTERKKLVEAYNEGKIRVALIAPSGTEGLSFKGTQLIQLLDPYWNPVRGKQSVGRALRFDSHTDLPDELKNVKVQRYVSRLPLGFKDRLLSSIGFNREHLTHGADDYLGQLSSRKERLNKQFLDLLKDVGTTKQSALGIPSREDYGDLSKLIPGKLMDLIVQEHQARRAGKHYDLRFGSPETGLYSWALRKGLPEYGKKHLAIQQPLHSHEYGSFEGEIPEGYGAGKVKKHKAGQILITKISPNTIHFSTASERYPERFTLIRSGKDDKKWLLVNNTPREPLPYEKVHFKTIESDKVEGILKDLQPGTSVQEKIDGAASLSELLKDKIELLSYRKSKVTGGPINYTEKLFHKIPELIIPKEYKGSVLRGETYGLQNGQAIPVQSLSGILNSSLAKSLLDQRNKNIQLKNMVYDIHQLGKKTVDVNQTPYSERLNIVRKLLGSIGGKDRDLVNSIYHLPTEAKTPEEALKMWRDIKAKKNPLTDEGVVIHPLLGKPTKAKAFEESDVYIREFFPGMGKYTNRGVGGFRYSHTPTGPVVGEVGTGFDDEMREEFYKNPENYLNQIARVQHTGRLPSNALFQPSFLGLHLG